MHWKVIVSSVLLTIFYAANSSSLDNMDTSRKNYISHAGNKFEYIPNSVSILDPCDDVLMLHGVEFSKCNKEKNSVRIAICFRWLKARKDFYSSTCGMRVDKKATLKLTRWKVRVLMLRQMMHFQITLKIYLLEFNFNECFFQNWKQMTFSIKICKNYSVIQKKLQKW